MGPVPHIDCPVTCPLAPPVGFQGQQMGLGLCSLGLKSALSEAGSDFSSCVTSGVQEEILFQPVL